MNILKNKNKLFAALAPITAFILICAFFAYLLYNNTNIETTHHTFENSKIPNEFSGFKICHVSDLHSAQYGDGQSVLIEKVANTQPDVIFITGDLIDRRNYNLEAAMAFVNAAVKTAPVYYVSGNHEAWSGEYTTIKAGLESAGVTVLDDEKTTLEQGGVEIDLYGLCDPDFLTSSYMDGTNDSALKAQLEAWRTMYSENGDSANYVESTTSGELGSNITGGAVDINSELGNNFSILLSHRPELFDIYVQYEMNLVFSGHAHGGQIRLPFVGGLFAPDQGFFPKYTNGFYTEDGTSMFVSRGLGNSVFPLRVFNRPHLAVIELMPKTT